MRPSLGFRRLILLTSIALLALPIADAVVAPKARVKFQTKVTILPENAGDGLAHVVVLTFGPNETSKEILVPICDDAIVEGGEFVNVSLTKPVPSVVIAGGTAQIAIADNDGPARVVFATTATLAFENGGPAVLTVIRLGDPNPAVSVDYTTSGGTATAGDDYTPANGTLSFPSIATDPTAATLRSINVGLVDDLSAELDEDMSVVLSNPRETATGNPLAAATPGQSTVTILDDDAPASIAFAVPSATVGEAGDSVTITLRRSGAPDDSVSASYTTVDGTALAGFDYTSTVFNVNEPGADPLFGPGEVEIAFSVPITDDSTSDGDEVFGLTLSELESSSGPVGVSTRPSMNVTITDDEPPAEGGPTTGNEPVAAAPAGADAPATTVGAGAAPGQLAATCGLMVRAAKKQRLGRRGTIRVRVATKQACTIRVRAKIKSRKPGSRAGLTKAVTKELTAGQRTVVKLRLSKKAMRSITPSLRANRRVSARALVRAVTGSGDASRRTIALRVVR